MAKSMTGYGRGEAVDGERKIVVEMKSVNNRYLDLNIRMPRAFSYLESEARNAIKAFAGRGKIDCYVSYEDHGEGAANVQYNEALAGVYYAHLKQMKETFSLSGEIDVATLASFPEVLSVSANNEEDESLKDLLLLGIKKAGEAFAAAREQEGNFLAEDIRAKLANMQMHRKAIEEKAPELVQAFREELTAKVRELLSESSIDDTRIVQEVTLYADKVAVDEELVRLSSHIESMLKELDREENIGRKLDFLAQEMNREANTILSKSDDPEISEHAIELKTEIEKIREQVQNIE